MTIKEKLILVSLSIITLGIYPLVVFNKKHNNTKDQLSVADKVTVNVEKLVEAFGGKDNIIGSEYTHTKIKVFIKDRTKVDIENVKNIKNISGVFASSKDITIIVGNQAKALAELI